MTSIRPFSMFDLLKYNNVNLDALTETFYTHFYGTYLSQWPEYCVTATNSGGYIEGYILGKVEGNKEDEAKKNWHGHVTAVTVAPEFRRRGLARILMNYLEKVTSVMHNGFFVDLFVRATNHVAIKFYEKLGYINYRTVKGYYSASDGNQDEDAWDMRKSMPRDKKKECIKTEKKIIEPEELEFH